MTRWLQAARQASKATKEPAAPPSDTTESEASRVSLERDQSARATGGGPDIAARAHPQADASSPRTWTGRVVSLQAWREMTDWERHGPRGRLWNGITKQWEP